MKTFNVKMRVTVEKLVTCVCESEHQARTNPWDHAQDETELQQVDWEVESVEEVE